MISQFEENIENQSADKSLYPLDWKTTDVTFAKKRFTHTLRRPSVDMILDREQESETEIPIAKDGSYSLPDGTVQEEIDAKYYDLIKVSADGYGDREIPTRHKAQAFQGLYQSEIYVEEETGVFGDEIVVLQEIGGTETNPKFSVKHILLNPDEKTLADNFALSLADVYPFQPDDDGTNETPTQSVNVYDAPEGGRFAESLDVSKRLLNLKFSGADKDELRELKTFHSQHYPEQSFIYRDYSVTPPEDIECYLNSQYKLDGKTNDWNYVLELLEK